MKYLFEGQIKGQPYDARSLQLILKQAQKQESQNPPPALVATHCDTLTRKWYRFTLHSRIISHSSSKTTEIYTHVSTKSLQQIKSPFDDL
jgi:integrase/recombinase XerD